ncbi:hypothetical protein GMORB2_6703 [Geosmithia morbida]|uniref:Cell division cycle protein 123 n=1 Tax=Geosmithia morbida TaxID=1094350 RepID=A0A9P5D4V8_9HYPO|nr:uncharacterized protein GMORB2_6703 [Geosmithia morbida]KAF4123155.1 hypothetical protein GMORB2_6703 [Geosmithia morbida]
MPHLPTQDGAGGDENQELIFPPVTRDHILNCSYDAWFPRYKSSCLKSRIIPLSPAFVSYLHEDGIILADDEDDVLAESEEEWHTAAASHPRRVEEVASDDGSEPGEDDDDDDEPDRRPPNERFPEIHRLIKEKIAELGGSVAPKLNWSSPKDAKWISPHQNTLKCTTPNDVYLLLKSSSFVSHDLDHAFDDCTAAPASRPPRPVLVLRPFFSPHVALEFRCFVKQRALVGITQRDLNHYDFLAGLRPSIVRRIRAFFRRSLRLTFPDPCFTFDVYIPENSLSDDGLGRVRLMDINPWAPRTDSLLFSWRELLDAEVARPLYGSAATSGDGGAEADEGSGDTSAEETDESDEALQARGPELRIIEKGDPAAYNFSSPQYSAHKLPREVVDASAAGGTGLREFARQWKELTEGRADGMWEKANAAGPGTSN